MTALDETDVPAMAGDLDSDGIRGSGEALEQIAGHEGIVGSMQHQHR